MFRKLNNKELDAVWADLDKAAAEVRKATLTRDVIALYKASDTIDSATIMLRKHEAALVVEKGEKDGKEFTQRP